MGIITECISFNDNENVTYQESDLYIWYRYIISIIIYCQILIMGDVIKSWIISLYSYSKQWKSMS